MLLLRHEETVSCYSNHQKENKDGDAKNCEKNILLSKWLIEPGFVRSFPSEAHGGDEDWTRIWKTKQCSDRNVKINGGEKAA